MDKFVFLLCWFIVYIDSVIIRTPQGLVDGRIEAVDGHGEITKFLGIPYAEAPVKNLRFQSPRPARNFTQVYDAKYGRWLCPQPESYLSLLNLTRDSDVAVRTDEDCLYLNVYVPGSVRLGTNFPVMVWIHGGGWIFSAGSNYDARKLAAMGRVIVVTINYRLGILGYLPDGSTAGSLGLQDQIAALKWVRWNIWSYGGDPGMVTIFGASSGGASISYLISSPEARNLFHRAIMQGGQKSAFLAFDDERRKEKMRTLAIQLRNSGCRVNIEECLRRASADELVNSALFVMSSLSLNAWSPHADGRFIRYDASNNTSLIQPDLELIIGFNSDEGGAMVEHMCAHASGESCNLYEGIGYSEVRRWTAYNMDLVSIERIGRQYQTWYPGPMRRDTMSLRAAAAFTTDWYERFPANRTASKWRDSGRDIWVYEFNAKPKDDLKIFFDVPWSEEAQHYDELPFVFGLVRDEGDQLISKAIINYWTSFAKGRPSSSWPQFGPDRKYLYIGRLDTKPIHFEIRHPLVSYNKDKFWRPWFHRGQFPPESKSESHESSAQTLSHSALLLILSVNTVNLLLHAVNLHV